MHTLELKLRRALLGLPAGSYAFELDGAGNIKPVLLQLEDPEELIWDNAASTNRPLGLLVAA